MSSNWHKNHLPFICHLTVIKHIAFIAQHYFNFPPQVLLIVSLFKPKEEEENKEANSFFPNDCSEREWRDKREKREREHKCHSFPLKLDLNNFKDALRGS